MLSRERKARLCLMPSCKGKRFDLVHKFPMDNERAEQWRTILNHLPELHDMSIDSIRKRFFICSKHFRKEDYKNCESRNLNKTAYPRLLLSEKYAASDAQTDDVVPVALTAVNVWPKAVPSQSEVRIEHQSSMAQFLHNSDIKPNLSNLPKTIRILPASKSISIIKSLPNSRELFKLKTIRIDGIPDKLILPSAVPAKIDCPTRASQTAILGVDTEQTSLAELPAAETIPFELEQTDALESLNGEQRLPEINLRENYLEIHHPTSESPAADINYYWLRDHCRCAKCYAEDTHQRSINILDIPLDIKPVFCAITNDDLHIEWIDGHKSCYDIKRLLSLQNANVSARTKNIQSKFHWRGKTMETQSYARVPLNDYLCREDVAKSVVQSLLRFGVAFIENVPVNSLSTELAIRRLFPVQSTLFGAMWGLDQVKEHSDSAYTNEALSAHNDNTYLNDAGGLQVFHCIENAESGGESLLVDGFRALKDLQAKHPESYQRLCEVNVPSEYIENGEHHVYCAPIVRLDPTTNEPEQIRFNLADRAPMTTLPQGEMIGFYRALRDLASEIQLPENEWWFKLTPGTVCIFDNWRVLHGRAMYIGRRKLVGCYVSHTNFMSAARNFDLI